MSYYNTSYELMIELDSIEYPRWVLEPSTLLRVVQRMLSDGSFSDTDYEDYTQGILRLLRECVIEDAWGYEGCYHTGNTYHTEMLLSLRQDPLVPTWAVIECIRAAALESSSENDALTVLNLRTYIRD